MLNFIEASEPIPQKPIFVVIAGLPGIGKTSAAFTAGDALVLDADLGIQRAIQKKRPVALRIEDYGQFKAALFSAEFAQTVAQRGLKNIVIDTVGALLDDVMANWLIKSDARNSRAGGLSLQGWGALQAEFGLLVNRIFDLGLNIIAVCHGKDDEDEATKSKTITLAVKGGSKEIILRKADMIGFITLQNGVRVLDFGKTANALVSKNTAALPPLAVPDADTPQYDNFVANIIEATKAKMTEASEIQLALTKAQDEFASKIAQFADLAELATLEAEIQSCEHETVRLAAQSSLANRYAELVLQGFAPASADEVNEFVAGLSEHPAAYKKFVWASLKRQAVELGYKYDSKSKSFVEPTEEGASDEA